MRWYPTKRRFGDMRIVWRFLWWPRCFEGEWRWLEWAGIQQEYKRWRTRASPDGPEVDVYGWRSVAWAWS